MTTRPGPHPAALEALLEARERAIARLSDAFAHDRMGLDEFEGRLTLAHRADSVSDVERVVADLVVAPPSAALATLAPATATLASEHEGIMAVFGGVERGGPWAVPRRLKVVAVCGGAVLDLREARFLPGVTEIHVRAVLGGVQIFVPPDLSVEMSGSAILGASRTSIECPPGSTPVDPCCGCAGGRSWEESPSRRACRESRRPTRTVVDAWASPASAC